MIKWNTTEIDSKTMKKAMDKEVEIQIEVSNLCNLKCRHCSNVINNKKLGYKLSNLINFFKLFEENLNIQLTGGEPTLNVELNNIIKLFKSLNKHVNIGIFSNGLKFVNNNYSCIPNDECTSLKLSGLDYCYFSIYHTDHNFHDLVTGVNNSLKHTKNTIRNFLKNNIAVKVHLIINKYNINNLNLIIKNLKDIGVSEIRLLKLVKTGEAFKNWHDIGVSYTDQFQTIKKILTTIDKNFNNITISGFPEIIPCRPVNHSHPCSAGIKLFYITYSGNLYPCACTRNNLSKKIAHISNLSSIKNYLIMNHSPTSYNPQQVYCCSV